MADYSLSDLAAINGNEGFGGGGWIVLIILFAMIFGWGGNGMGGGSRNASTEDVVYTSAFNQLQDENMNIINEVQRQAANVTSVVKDGQYNNLSEIRDLQQTTNNGFAEMQKCCCETLRAIDGVNYNNALNTEKILSAMAADKISDLQNQVNQLTLTQALCGVPKINPYFYGVVPYTAGCNCNANI